MKELINLPNNKKVEANEKTNDLIIDEQLINSKQQRAFEEGYKEAQNIIKLISDIKNYIKENGVVSIKEPFVGIDIMNVSIHQKDSSLEKSQIYLHLKYTNPSGGNEGITISLFDDGTLSSDGWKRKNLSKALGIDLSNIKNKEIFKNDIWNKLVETFIILIQPNNKKDNHFIWENDEKNPPQNNNKIIPKHDGEFDPRVQIYEEALGNLVTKFEFGKGDFAFVGLDFIIFTSKEYGKGVYLLPIPNSLLKTLSKEEILQLNRKDITMDNDIKGVNYKNMNHEQFDSMLNKIFPEGENGEVLDIKKLKDLVDIESVLSNLNKPDRKNDSYRINHPDHEDILTNKKKLAEFLSKLAKGLSKHFGSSPSTAQGKIMKSRRP
jgi:hypothetical protein